MSKHKKVDGKLLQMNKTYSQLKQRQKEKISQWMYQAYKKQVAENLPDDEALQFVFEKIDEAEIWIPDYEIEHAYNKRKSHFKDRMIKEKIPQHIFEMEAILDKANSKIAAFDARTKDIEEFQTEIKKLETYYTSQQWKDDLAMDEKGEFPKNLKRGVLSEDGIYNMLERNDEILDRINGRTEDDSVKTDIEDSIKVLRAEEEWQRAGAYSVRVQGMNRQYHIPLRDEFDEHDCDGTKYIVLFDDEYPVATCRFYEVNNDSVILGRLVVLPEYRGKNLGLKVVNEAEEWIKELGYNEILIDSRVEAIGFYEKVGYLHVDDTVIKSGDFDCIRMYKVL